MMDNCCPSIAELPSPPPGRSGWPWTVGCQPLPPTISDGQPWPRVSIITPSYNQAQFLEETIRSVLLQGYPNLEYIIIDGGSTDGSVEIIRKYEPWLSYWESKKDRGQAEAINKGFRRAAGEVVAWLNSDDHYLPDVFGTVIENLSANKADILFGQCRIVDPQGNILNIYRTQNEVDLRNLVFFWRYPFGCPPQPATFFRRSIIEKIGLLNENFHFALDYEYWLRASVKFKFQSVDLLAADYIVHPSSKTGRGWEPFYKESYLAGSQFWHFLPIRDQVNLRIFGKRSMYGKKMLEDYYRAYSCSDWINVRTIFKRILHICPICLLNRGVLSIYLKSLPNR